MNRLNIMRTCINCLVGSCLSVASLTACSNGLSQSGPTSVVPNSIGLPPASGRQAPLSQAIRTQSVTEKVLYSFGNSPDGASPYAGLTNVGGALYGTTDYGGTSTLCPGAGGIGGCGTAFKVTTSGTETVLHSFGSGADDGQVPEVALLNVSGTLYGSTCCGGKNGDGIFFSLTTKGKETDLYIMPDQEYWNTLINVGGKLYGTTVDGGKYGGGTVFAMTGKSVSVLHNFGKGTDGQHPIAALVNVGGTLYGTTAGGGKNTCGSQTCGTVFKITAAGAETVLHSFAGGTSDGAFPEAALIDVGGTLYGTTVAGGSGTGGSTSKSPPCYVHTKHFTGQGCGTVFSITTSGKESVVWNFGNGSDGRGPRAALLNVGGTLYGTTQSGGACYSCGTVFSVTTSGAETVLHDFGSTSFDGIGPQAGLIDVGGKLYGTTPSGGAHFLGTVYSVSGF